MCFGDESIPCSACLAERCCDDFGPCNADDACYPGYSCLLRCDGTFADCVDGCVVPGNARWTALASCGRAECGAEVCQP